MLLVMIVGVLALCAPSVGQTDAVRVRAVASPESAYVGQPVRLSIEVHGTTDAAQPVIDAVEGLDIRYAGAQDRSSSFTRIINGRRTERRTEAYVFQWIVRANEAGTYTIPSIEVTAGSVNYTTDPVRLRFEAPPTTEEMLLDVTLERDSAYVGEPVRATIDWYFARNPENWRFAIPGAGEAFDLVSPERISGRNGDPLQLRFMGREVTAHQARARVDGMNYARVRIEQMLIPRTSGTITLGGASVSADLVVREGFFDNETRYVIARAGEAWLEARPLPSEGRPRSFSGLIGRYRIEARASETDVRVGDPIEITLSVDGPLVESVNPPALHLQRDLTRDFRVPEDLGLSEIEGGRKVWRFTIRPTNADVPAIPPIELPYFDTDSGTYATASTEPIPLSVSPTRRVTLSDSDASAPLGVELEDSAVGIAHNYAGEDLLVDQRFSIVSALTSPSAIALTAGPAGFWAASAVFVAVRKRRVSRPRDGNRRAASIARHELGESNDPGAVSRSVYAYLGRKLDRSPAGLTPDSCAGALSDRSERLAVEARDLLEACDTAAYAPSAETDVGALRDRALRFIDGAERVWRGRS